MGLSRTIPYSFRDRRQFQSKIAKFSHHFYFAPPAERVPSGIWYRRWGQKTRMMGYRVDKEVWRYLQPSGYNALTWQTDGQTDRQTNKQTNKHRATAKTAVKWVSLIKSRTLRTSTVLNNSSNEEVTKYFLVRVSLKSVHPTRMCSTVSGHWQVVHSGWSAPDNKQECVHRI